MDTRRRSIVKAVVWNLIGLIVMTTVAFWVTGSWTLGGGMALVNTVIGLAAYVLYERIWAAIRWGRHV